MNYFYRFYRWGLNMKFFMAIYFVAALAIYSVESLILGVKTVNIFFMLEMLLVYYGTAVVQKIILPDNSFSKNPVLKTRAVLWFFVSVLISAMAAYLFPWFQDFPSWAPIVYILFMTAGFIAMWAGILIIHQIDTKKLNEKLNHYQNK